MIRNIGIYSAAFALADLLFPRTCIVCGRQLSLRERHLCIYCLSDLPRTYFSSQPCNRMADRFNELIQRSRKADDQGYSPYVHASSLFYYRSVNGYRRITQRLKYHADFAAGRYFAGMLGREIASSYLFADVDAVIPVPLHWTRRWSRGYNQAEIIASTLASFLGAEFRKDILYRSRRTRTQTHLSVEKKIRNVSGAFKVRRSALLEGLHHILLVDDVFTTGATLHSCYSALVKCCIKTTRISIVTLGCVSD